MSELQITRTDSGVYRVVGSLVFATVGDALKQSAQIFSTEQQLAIDLSAVTSADSAGLALLIEWYRLAARGNKSIRFIGAPTQLRALAKISDIDALLPFS
jgi:phospholipid transport system transporter-binding protein